MLITTSVYMGSSIVSPAITEFSSVFGVGSVTATLTLSLFVVGYGVGPLFLSPISEIPQIGRSIPYIITLALFCILQVPTALVNNFAGLVSFFGLPLHQKWNKKSWRLVYPSIPCWIYRFTTSSYWRSFATRCFPPYQTTLRNGSLRSSCRLWTRPCSCHQWVRCSCKWMEMGFLDHVVVIWIQFGIIGFHHARGESIPFLSLLRWEDWLDRADNRPHPRTSSTGEQSD